jgi:hypothetical protein
MTINLNDICTLKIKKSVVSVLTTVALSPARALVETEGVLHTGGDGWVGGGVLPFVGVEGVCCAAERLNVLQGADIPRQRVR